jgi:hypothetical protein
MDPTKTKSGSKEPWTLPTTTKMDRGHDELRELRESLDFIKQELVRLNNRVSALEKKKKKKAPE